MKKFLSIILIFMITIPVLYGMCLTVEAASFSPVWPLKNSFNVSVLDYYSDSFGQSRGSGTIHGGLDISTSGNPAVYPVADGVVLKVSNNCNKKKHTIKVNEKSVVYNNCTGKAEIEKHSSGNYVIVKHDTPNGTYISKYLHLKYATNKTPVKAGDTVKAGETILGYSGATGSASGEHLHLEIFTSKETNSKLGNNDVVVKNKSISGHTFSYYVRNLNIIKNITFKADLSKRKNSKNNNETIYKEYLKNNFKIKSGSTKYTFIGNAETVGTTPVSGVEIIKVETPNNQKPSDTQIVNNNTEFNKDNKVDNNNTVVNKDNKVNNNDTSLSYQIIEGTFNSNNGKIGVFGDTNKYTNKVYIGRGDSYNWIFEKQSDGYYTVKNKDFGGVLSIDERHLIGETVETNGTYYYTRLEYGYIVKYKDYINDLGQKWILEGAKDKFSLKNVKTGLYLQSDGRITFLMDERIIKEEVRVNNSLSTKSSKSESLNKKEYFYIK